MRLTSSPVAGEIIRAFASEPFGDEDFDVRNVVVVDGLEGEGARH